MPFAHDGVRGVADFVLRVIDEETGQVSYEPVDAKLARSEAKPGHVLQLCFYAEAIEALTGTLPAQMHLWLGSGEFETIRTNDVMPYWRHLRSGSNPLMSEEGAKADTTPVPCDHCEVCDFEAMCEARWRSEDAVHLVANVRTVDLAPLEATGIETLEALADVSPGSELEGIDPDRLLSDVHPGGAATGGSRLAGTRRRRFDSSNRRTACPDRWGTNNCQSPTSATCFSTSRATRSGDPRADCSSCSAGSAATRRKVKPGATAGPTTPAGHTTWPRNATQVGELIEYLAERREQLPRHARLPLQPHRAVDPGAPRPSARSW